MSVVRASKVKTTVWGIVKTLDHINHKSQLYNGSNKFHMARIKTNNVVAISNKYKNQKVNE